MASKKTTTTTTTDASFSINSTNLEQAAIKVALRYPQECGKCHPETCGLDDMTDHNIGNITNDNVVAKAKQYWRMDQVGPDLQHAVSPRTDRLADALRLPAYLATANEAVWNDYILANTQVPQSTTPTFGSKLYHFMEYNPAIVPLPASQVPTDLPNNQSYYLGLLRLSTIHECLREESQRQRLGDSYAQGLTGKEAMAFVIMDAQLNILQQAVVTHHNILDHRLFVLNDDQLYIGYLHQLTQIWLRDPPPPPAGHVHMPLKPLNAMHKEMLRQDNDFTVTIRASPVACCTSPACRGKNFNYFQIRYQENGTVIFAPDGTPFTMRATFVEIKPALPRVVERIHLQLACPLPLRMPLLKVTEETQLANLVAQDAKFKNINKVFTSSHSPDEAFATTDELYFSQPPHALTDLPYTTERGNACCVPIPNPGYNGDDKELEYLLVGVMHSKLPSWRYILDWKQHVNASFGVRQYAHRWYAFEPQPPFTLVAQSGKFCFGQGPTAAELEQNPNAAYLSNHVYHLNHTNLACPKIEFVTSMTEAIDDPKSVIVGYGINDCTARFVKIAKSEIMRMLGLSS